MSLLCDIIFTKRLRIHQNSLIGGSFSFLSIKPLRLRSQVVAVQYTRARQQKRRGKIGGGGCERQDADCNCFGWELETARKRY
jgi:hypothetical protein